jgi:hypothetical protein
VWKLDRLARSMKQLIETVEQWTKFLHRKGLRYNEAGRNALTGALVTMRSR